MHCALVQALHNYDLITTPTPTQKGNACRLCLFLPHGDVLHVQDSYVGTVCFRRAQILPTRLMRFKLPESLPFADADCLREVHCTIETEHEIRLPWNGMLVKAHACGMACPSVGAGRLLFVAASNQPRLAVSLT